MGVGSTGSADTRRSVLAAALAGVCLPGVARAQGYTPKFEDKPETLSGDGAGFQPIFDGRSLDGWAGDPTYWRTEGGALVGQVVPATRLKSNTFIVWQGGSPADFELKVDCRLSNPGNSGINYRSAIIPDPVTPANQFSMRGYQCDIDLEHGFTANSYEEKGRLFLALRGQVTHVTGLRKPTLLGTLGDPDDLGRTIGAEWNAYHVIARGNVIVHLINGRMMSMVIDDDPKRPRSGKIGVQVHQGFPNMKVEFRNFRLKLL